MSIFRSVDKNRETFHKLIPFLLLFHFLENWSGDFRAPADPAAANGRSRRVVCGGGVGGGVGGGGEIAAVHSPGERAVGNEATIN